MFLQTIKSRFEFTSSCIFRRHIILKILFLALATQFLFFHVNCQKVPAPKIESPNTATLGEFGEVPVGLFTGTPDITIPIHTLSVGKIKVPVALRYHPGSVRPSQHPGWAGLGWDLQSIGTINRKVNKNYDEYCNQYDPVGSVAGYTPYFPYSSCSNNKYGPSGSERVDVSNWDTQERLIYYFTKQPSTSDDMAGLSDVGADEFTFNFLEYSGKFFYSGATKQWAVISDQDIKVELNGFILGDEVFSAIQQFKQFESVGIADDGATSRWFKGFTLTVPDGTRFVFGGRDAVEFDSPYGVDGWNFKLNTWLLSQVIDADGNVVNFVYRRRYPNVSLSFGAENSTFSVKNTQGGFLNQCADKSFSYSPINARRHGGTLFWPMYLSKIACGNEMIEFTGSVATCKRYTDIQLRLRDEEAPTDKFSILLPLHDNVDNLQWEQLDDIYIKNSSSEVIKQYTFDFTRSITERLTLLSFKEKDKSGALIKKHDFFYDGIAALPMYDGNYTDHWGFYNNRDVHGLQLSHAISTGRRETDPDLVTKGLLTQITYPTGGYSKFTWKPHDYSEVVSMSRDALINSQGFAGGSRIFKIEHYSADGSLATEKTYYYKRNYSAGVNANTLQSSGVLNGLPKYVFDLNNRSSLDNRGVYTIHFESLNTYSTYGHNGQGSHVGYDEVVEVNKDGSYIKNFFTSYGPDLNGVSHFDVTPAYIGWVKGDDPYFQMSSLEKERGKPIGIFEYKSDNVLLRKSVTTYRDDESRFDNFIKVIDLNNSWHCNSTNSWLALASARKEYKYSYYPVKTEVTSYDEGGKNPLVSTTNYTYNIHNQITETSHTNSKGETVKNRTTYPTDYPNTEPYATMILKNIIVPVIEQSLYKGTAFLQSTKTNYAFWGTQKGWGQPNSIVPHTIESKVGLSEAKTKVRFHLYDDRGNALTLSKEGDIKSSYIWFHNRKYPIAKVDNADYNEIVHTSFEADEPFPGVLGGNHSQLFSYSGNRVLDPSAPTGRFVLSSPGFTIHGKSSGILTYWARNGPATFMAPATHQSLMTNGAWTLYKTTFTDPQSIIILTGPSDLVIDELRYYPVTAQMTTYTYDPLIGMTSSTDFNNRTTYYEYDDFGRLQYVRDHDRNILKKLCYNYAGQTETCPLGVGNDLRTKLFYKNNCDGSGKSGVPVTYVLRANTYYAKTLEEANALAQLDLDTKGQAWANENGTCLQGVANDERKAVFTRTNCAGGAIGQPINYIVPAGKYGAATKNAANQLADDDIAANGSHYANIAGSCAYPNAAINANYYSVNCTGQTPVAYPVSIASGTYTSTISQADADALAELAAQDQANQYGICTSAPTLYARLEAGLSHSDDSRTYNNNNFVWERNYYQQIEIYIRFYSDPQCTVPYTLASSVDINLSAFGYKETYSEGNYTSDSYRQSNFYQGIAGTHEVFVDNILSFEGFWGTEHDDGYLFYEKWRDDYELSSVSGGFVIRPSLYPVHSQGY